MCTQVYNACRKSSPLNPARIKSDATFQFWWKPAGCFRDAYRQVMKQNSPFLLFDPSTSWLELQCCYSCFVFAILLTGCLVIGFIWAEVTFYYETNHPTKANLVTCKTGKPWLWLHLLKMCMAGDLNQDFPYHGVEQAQGTADPSQDLLQATWSPSKWNWKWLEVHCKFYKHKFYKHK